jgi:hypothetical protein
MSTTTQPMVACPKCQGPTWDNRATKKNPSAPDFKCRDRSCDGVIWPPRQAKQGGNGQPPVQQKPVAAPSAYVGDLPGDAGPVDFGVLCERYLECARFVAASKIPAASDPQAFASIVATIFIARNQRNV